MQLTNLRDGHTQSCGCLKQERRYKHGLWGTRVYRAWNAMLQRCENPRDRNFYRYGGRGITVHAPWHNFSQFYVDVGDPEPHRTLERIDNNGPYAPWNVRWATMKEQHQNQRNTRHYEYNGVVRTLTEWADVLGVTRELIRARLRRGKTFAEAIRNLTT